MSADVRRACEEFLAVRPNDGRLTLALQLSFTLLDAQFVVPFVQQHHNLVKVVKFCHYAFEDDETMQVLKKGFLKMPDVEVHVHLERDHLPNGIRSLPYFPSLTTSLWLYNCDLGDDGFGYAVDTILHGSGKEHLKELFVRFNKLSCSSLPHATRLLQESKVEILCMGDNPGLLNNREQMQAFCDDGLKKTDHLKRIDVDFCGASDSAVKVTADMLANALTVNISLTYVAMHQQRQRHESRAFIHRQLEPSLKRNIQISILRSLLDGAQEVQFTTPARVLHHMVQSTRFLDSPGLSALYLALRHATVGRQGEADPLVLRVTRAMIEQERRQREQKRWSTQIQRWWQACEAEQHRRQRERCAAMGIYVVGLTTLTAVVLLGLNKAGGTRGSSCRR